MQRRTLLKAGLFGGGLLLAAGGALRLAGSNAQWAATGQSARKVLAAVMPVLLAGALPDDPALRSRRLDAGLQRTLIAIAELPLAVRNELGQLFALLDSAPGRWLAGVDRWDGATADELAPSLQSWRVHRLALMKTAYLALHDLVLGPWYADPSTWEAIGYPGPIQL